MGRLTPGKEKNKKVDERSGGAESLTCACLEVENSLGIYSLPELAHTHTHTGTHKHPRKHAEERNHIALNKA